MIAAGNKKVVKEVMIEKKARKASGLILSKKPHVTDKAEVLGVRIILYFYCSLCTNYCHKTPLSS